MYIPLLIANFLHSHPTEDLVIGSNKLVLQNPDFTKYFFVQLNKDSIHFLNYPIIKKTLKK